jgi:hypothetical protein
MPSYSYVTPYQGQQVAPLPAGYMEAATAPGRNIAAGISKFGENVTGLVKEYIKNKREDEYATSKIESMLAQYAGSTQGPPTANGTPAGTDQLAGIIGQKNLDAFVGGKANRMQKLAIANSLEAYGAQQHQRLQNQLIGEQLKAIPGTQEHQRLQNQLIEEQVGALQNQRSQQGILADAIRQASAMPTVAETVTTNQQLRYPADVQVTEPAPASVVPPRYSEINKAPQMYEDLMSQVQALRSTGGNVPGMPSLSAPNYGLASLAPKPISLPNARPSVPVEAPAQQMITKTVPAQGPPELITEKKVSSSPIPYADTRAQLMKYLSEKGADAATLSSVDSILHAAGRAAPMKVTEVPLSGGGYAVNVDGKVEIVKPIEGKDLTESQSNALTFASRMHTNEGTINDVLKSGYEPKSLTEFSFTTERLKTTDRKSYEAAKGNWIAANLRKESGAAIGKEEYADADKQYFPQAGDSKSVIEQKAKLRQIAFNAMKTAVGKHADDYLGQVLGGSQPEGGSLPRVQLKRQF